jgi:hypothetical protein
LRSTGALASAWASVAAPACTAGAWPPATGAARAALGLDAAAGALAAARGADLGLPAARDPLAGVAGRAVAPWCAAGARSRAWAMTVAKVGGGLACPACARTGATAGGAAAGAGAAAGERAAARAGGLAAIPPVSMIALPLALVFMVDSLP